MAAVAKHGETGKTLFCKTHEDQPLQPAGGTHHPPATGWCPRCNTTVQGYTKDR